MDQNTVDTITGVLYAFTTVVFIGALVSAVVYPAITTQILVLVWFFIGGLLVDDRYGSSSDRYRVSMVIVHSALFALLCILIGLVLSFTSKDPNLVYSISLSSLSIGKLYQKYSILFVE